MTWAWTDQENGLVMRQSLLISNLKAVFQALEGGRRRLEEQLPHKSLHVTREVNGDKRVSKMRACYNVSLFHIAHTRVSKFK